MLFQMLQMRNSFKWGVSGTWNDEKHMIFAHVKFCVRGSTPMFVPIGQFPTNQPTDRIKVARAVRRQTSCRSPQVEHSAPVTGNVHIQIADCDCVCRSRRPNDETIGCRREKTERQSVYRSGLSTSRAHAVGHSWRHRWRRNCGVIRPVSSSVRHGRPLTRLHAYLIYLYGFDDTVLSFRITSLRSKTISIGLYIATPKRPLLPRSLEAFLKDRSLDRYSLLYVHNGFDEDYWARSVCYLTSSLTTRKSYTVEVHSAEWTTYI